MERSLLSHLKPESSVEGGRTGFKGHEKDDVDRRTHLSSRKWAMMGKVFNVMKFRKEGAQQCELLSRRLHESRGAPLIGN